MKTKLTSISYDELLKIKPKKTKSPKKPNILFRTLLKIISTPDLWKVKFKVNRKNMDKLSKKEPCLILMNHSSFIDMEIAQSAMYPRPMNIITTADGFVGLNWLMRQIGCVPTIKFTNDLKMIKEMVRIVKDLKSSILLYPEASYSFDGTATPLPNSVGKFIKLLKVPVVTIITKGAFTRQPLYNNLQKRKVPVSCDVEYLLTKEDVETKSEQEIMQIVKEKFTFDNWKWQQENNIKVTEPFRADYLNRALYKCPHCGNEGNLKGEGIYLSCPNCGAKYELTELGFLKCLSGVGKFDQVPDWYKWERECVRNEILEHKYEMNLDVDVCMMIDTYHIYKVGEGNLVHNEDGFTLNAFDNKLNYHVPSNSTYSVYSDYNWYEIGDMISIGDTKKQYYCFPKTKKDVVAKIRLAAEELYKIKNESK